MRLDEFKIALAQFAPRLGDVERQTSHILKLTTRAKTQHADLVVFPNLR